MAGKMPKIDKRVNFWKGTLDGLSRCDYIRPVIDMETHK